MKIRSLTAFEVPVALRKPVRHASHIRHQNDTLIVRCELADGSIGWGEGLPRTYVTGESIASVWRHLTETSFAILLDTDFADPLHAVSVLDSLKLAEVPPDAGVEVRECFGNSARCAIELAVLDAVCRTAQCSIGGLLTSLPEAAEISEQQDTVFYSGVVTSGSGLQQWRSALKMRAFRFRSVKVKVGTSGIDDQTYLSRVRRIVGNRVDLRLDANEAWHCDQVISKIQPLLKWGPTCVEQPVAHTEVGGLAHIRADLSIPIMLDESLCSVEDAHAAIQARTCDLFNLRISKCGGLVNCVRLAALAKQNDLNYQLGCQVGETGILSAAGRHFACNISGIRYLEGSYDRFLVRQPLTFETLTFRYGGRAKRLSGFGLGITVDEEKIRAMAVRTMPLS